jgi:hypothetical protein
LPSGIPNQPEHDMTSFVKAAGFAGILVAVFATVTPDLKAAQLNNAVRENQAVVTQLGANASAITYWVSESDGWHVVTTVDTAIEQNGDAEKHAVVRFSSVLLPGQSQLISVPFAIGERQQVLRIRRLGDQIEVARVGGSA